MLYMKSQHKWHLSANFVEVSHPWILNTIKIVQLKKKKIIGIHRYKLFFIIIFSQCRKTFAFNAYSDVYLGKKSYDCTNFGKKKLIEVNNINFILIILLNIFIKIMQKFEGYSKLSKRIFIL